MGEVKRKPQAEAVEELAALIETALEATGTFSVPLLPDEARTIAAALRRLAKLEAAAREAEAALERVTQAIDDELHNSPVHVSHTSDGTPYLTSAEWRRGVELGERMSVARTALAALRTALGDDK